MDLPETIFRQLYYAILFLTFFSHFVQGVILCSRPKKVWKSRKTSGISINFLVLCILAFLFKYLQDDLHEHQMGIFEALKSTRRVQYWGRIILLILMLAIFCTSLCYRSYDDKEFEDMFGVSCICGGFIVSLILGADHYLNSANDLWMVGSYLEVIAWIAQIQYSLKGNTIDPHVLFLIVGMFLYETLTTFGLSYDFDRTSLYGKVGYKLSILKVFLFCGFFLNYCLCEPPTENKINKIVPSAPPQTASKENLQKKDSDKPVYCIPVEDTVSPTEK